MNKIAVPDIPADSKILVTGGAGFIGSNIVEFLLNAGFHVVCLDNFSTGFKTNLTTALTNPKFTLVEGDMRSVTDCKKAIDGCSYILHQAALGSVPRSVKDPATTTDVNEKGFVNILKTAVDCGIKRVVYASSSSVYGDDKAPIKREESIGNALSPYAVSKQACEMYANVFSRVYGLEVVGLRYFNVFGRRQSPEGAYAAVIPRFVDALAKGESPIIYGDGSNSRDFTYIDNVISANMLAMTTKNDVSAKAFNIACGSTFTLIELFNELKKNIDGSSVITPSFASPRAGDIPHSHADISKAKELLSYEVLVSFADGIRRTCQWYMENL